MVDEFDIRHSQDYISARESDTNQRFPRVASSQRKAMQVIGRKRLNECMREHADTRGPLDTWVRDIEAASWQTPVEVRNRYASVSIVTGHCLVFDIKGGHYRLITLVNYMRQVILVLWAGTHSEYDRVSAEELCEEADDVH